ncbi:MAG TPA: alpha/beta fold hydrolase [Gammaproteobacteria bacterium]|nr:alpha/beta fold hydrolase [Gammaproteobacteria bacterium]
MIKTNTANLPDNPTECVILLHGLLRSKKQMRYIESTLIHHGFEVINVNYSSNKHSIDSLTDLVWNEIKKPISHRKVNFVGYSMGGLLARNIIDKYKPKSIGRVILIGTPNNGSELATFLQDNFFYQKLIGPAGQEIGTKNNTTKRLKTCNYELGCIASRLNGLWKIIYPISYFLLPKINDGRVSLKSTKVDGMKSHVIISCPHFFLPYSKKVNKYIVSFLKTGFF